MRSATKFLIGLAATMLMGWLWHGPLGQGKALIDRLQGEATTVVIGTEVPGIHVRLARHPLARVATLDGPANDLQREGLGSQKGISDYVRDVDGLARVQWADEAKSGGMPLLVETLLLLVIAYLVGWGVGRLFWGRPEKHGYL